MIQLYNSILKIIFIGTPEFGAIILEGLIKTNFKPTLVITAPDKLTGRGQILTSPSVKIMAERYDIPVLQPEKVLNIKNQILTIKPDLIIVAAYGQIIPAEILEIPKKGSLNLHPSLLPKYRGPSPIQTAILNGDKETGATIILMDVEMDHGPILSSKNWLIADGITHGELSKELANLGAELLIETIPRWTKDEIRPSPQDDSKATYTKIIKKDDGKIDWEKPAEKIKRQIRAFHPWPESFTFWKKNDKKNLRLKILKAKVSKLSNINYSIGKTFISSENELCVQCGNDFLTIEELQLEGKKPMNSEEFLRGHPDFIGAVL